MCLHLSLTPCFSLCPSVSLCLSASPFTSLFPLSPSPLVLHLFLVLPRPELKCFLKWQLRSLLDQVCPFSPQMAWLARTTQNKSRQPQGFSGALAPGLESRAFSLLQVPVGCENGTPRQMRVEGPQTAALSSRRGSSSTWGPMASC